MAIAVMTRRKLKCSKHKISGQKRCVTDDATKVIPATIVYNFLKQLVYLNFIFALLSIAINQTKA